MGLDVVDDGVEELQNSCEHCDYEHGIHYQIHRHWGQLMMILLVMEGCPLTLNGEYSHLHNIEVVLLQPLVVDDEVTLVMRMLQSVQLMGQEHEMQH